MCFVTVQTPTSTDRLADFSCFIQEGEEPYSNRCVEMVPTLNKTAFLRKLEEEVSEAILTLVVLSQEPGAEGHFALEHLHPTCKKLEDLVCLASSLADEISNHFVNFILSAYRNLEGSYCRNDRKKEAKRRSSRFLAVRDMYPNTKRQSLLCKKRIIFCREIALEVGCALFHPSTTRLDFCYSNMARNPTFSGFANSFLDRLLKKGRNLAHLTLDRQLSRTVVLDNLPRLRQLETFSFPNATDAILETLSVCCTNLQCLNVSHSSCVTDEGAMHIAKMSRLQSLKVDGTRITDFGFSTVMCQVPCSQSTEYGLLSLRARMTPAHIDALADSFPNLNSLEVYLTEYCDISPLKMLKNLQILNLFVGVEAQKAPSPPSSPVSLTGFEV